MASIRELSFPFLTPFAAVFLIHSAALADCLSSVARQSDGTPILQCSREDVVSCAQDPPMVYYLSIPNDVIRDLVDAGYTGDNLTALIAANLAAPEKVGGVPLYRCVATDRSSSSIYNCLDLRSEAPLPQAIGLIRAGIPIPSRVAGQSRTAYPGSSFTSSVSKYSCLQQSSLVQHQEYALAPAQYLIRNQFSQAAEPLYAGYHVLRVRLTNYPVTVFQRQGKRFGFSIDPTSLTPLMQQLNR